MKLAHVLVLAVASLVACSPAPASTPDSSMTADVVTVDSAAPQDAPAATDSATNADTATTADTGATGDGLRCGATMSLCGPSQVCCAATGPMSPERCVDAMTCSAIRCDATSQCPPDNTCCTDGIQSTCRSNRGVCGFRACRTAADCEGSDQCCPFGAGQRRCGSCG